MMHFAKKVNTPSANGNLYFNRIYTPAGLRYRISFIGQAKKTLVFDMEERSGKWALANLDTAPSWVIKIENELSDYINVNAHLHSL
jgi:hypothetical protein